MKNNVVLEESPGGLKITVKSGNLGPLVYFLFMWIIAMTYGAIEAAIHLSGLMPLLAVWIAWAAVVLAPLAVLYWGITGREIIITGRGMMKVRNEVLGAGWDRSYELPLISAMRMNAVTGKGPYDVRAGQSAAKKGSSGMGLIDFMYRGKIHRFCLSADNKDAETVLEGLKKTLPKNIFE